MTKTQPRRLKAIEGNPETQRVVKAELHLEQWAIWKPAESCKGQAKFQTRTLKKEKTLPDGRKITESAEIGFSHYGTLTTDDHLVAYACFQIWKEKNNPLHWTAFSLYKIAQILKKTWGGDVYKSLLASLRRLRTVPITFRLANVEKSGDETDKDIIEIPIQIFSDLRLRRREKTKGETVEFQGEGYFKFDPLILQYLIQDFTKPVLLDVVLSLKSDIAQVIYTYADRQLAFTAKHERTTAGLFKDIGLDAEEYRYPSRRKRTIERVSRELDGKLLSSGGVLAITLSHTKDKTDYKLIFEKKARLAIVAADADQPAIEKPAEKAIAVKEPSEKEPTEAEKLVLHFHQVFFGKTAVAFGKRELEHARALIAVHGFEAAKAVIETAKREAPKTNFDIKTFGGVMQYQTSAAAKVEAKKERVEKEQAARVEEEREALRWEKYFEPYVAFAQAQLTAIQASNPEAYAKFDVTLKDHLKLFEQFNLAANDRVMIEATFAHAHWFFNDAFAQRYRIHFVTFTEWDKEHNAAPR